MNTDELINALGADAGANPPRSLARDWCLSLVAGTLVAAAMMAAMLRVRADIWIAVGDPRFLFKFVATLALAIPAGRLAMDLARPGARPGRRLAALLVAPALVLVVAIIDLALSPASTWLPQAEGQNAIYCTLCVPLLSLAPLAGFLYALSRAAPTDPRLAGLIAGLASAGVGATIYALHCTDDSPLFVMLWYTLGVAITGAIGAWLGPRVLRW